MNFMIFQCLRC